MKIYQPIISGSINVFNSPTASVVVQTLPSSSAITNVVLYDSASGQLYYTASSEIGGGSGVGVGFPFSGSAVITGSLLVSGSGVEVIGNQIISGSLTVSGSDTIIIGNQTTTGSLRVSGSGTLIGNQTITGSLTVSGSNTIIIGNQTITGSLNISGSNLNLSGTFDVNGGIKVADLTYQSNQQIVSWNSSTKQLHYMAGGDVVVFPYTGSAIFSASVESSPAIRTQGNIAVTGAIGFVSASTNTELNGIYIGTDASTSFANGYTIQFPSGNLSTAVNTLSLFEINDISRPIMRLNTKTTDTFGAQIQFFRNRSGAVQVNQELGELRFHSAYTATPQIRYGRSAQILVVASSGSNERSTPARMMFATTPSASILPIVRLQIEDNGNIGIGSFSGSAATASATLHVSGSNIILDIPSKQNGYVLSSDANGGATWVQPATLAVFPYTGSAIISGSVTSSAALSVTGSVGISNNLIVSGNVSLGDATTDTITMNAATMSLLGNLNIDSNTLFVDGGANRVGIGTTSPSRALHVSGTMFIINSQTGSTIVPADGTALYVKYNATADALDTSSDYPPILALHNANNPLTTSQRYNLISFQHGNNNGTDPVGIARIGTRKTVGANGTSVSNWAGDFFIQLRNGNALNSVLYISSSTNVGISTIVPRFRLDVSGSGRFTDGLSVTGSMHVSGSVTASYVSSSTGLRTPRIIDTGTQIGIGTVSPTHLTHISASTNQILKVEGSGSSNPIFLVEGSQGELFSVTDNISGSLFSVNDNSGLPVIDVISDSTILMGNYSAPSLNTTVKLYTYASNQSLYQIQTSSYDAAFVEYYFNSGSSYGSIYATINWTGSISQINQDYRAVTGLTPTLTCTFTGSYANIGVTTPSTGYLIKAIIRAI